MIATASKRTRALILVGAGLVLLGAVVASRRSGALAGPTGAIVAGRGAHDHEQGISHYTCSMHPSVRSNAPGTCPICSMDLVPVSEEEVRSGVVRVDDERRQRIGVETGRVERKSVTLPIRAFGEVMVDETGLTDVTLRIRGWIGRVFAGSAGVRVDEGDPLFTVHAPELLATQEELLQASRGSAGRSSLGAAARRRLRLWNLTPAQIDEIARAGEAREHLPILSPAGGVVIEKNVVEGSTAEAGMRLYRIADLSTVWIEAEIYESDVPLVRVGQRAEVTLSHLPGQAFSGAVSHVYPYLSADTRTGRVRIPLANEAGTLRPGMYATVELRVPLGENLVVPEEAVLMAGETSVVFLDLGEGRLRPQRIEVGRKTPDGTIVVRGLEEGAAVVTSGNFLIAAESRLKSGMASW